jgi:hypothetical protein
MTVLARASSFALMLSLTCSTEPRLISNRILPPSRRRLINPPFYAKFSVSPIVSTGAAFKVANSAGILCS